jgi:chemosensory pili system protein ChpA (sensor histidine kinase/response regulator)
MKLRVLIVDDAPTIRAHLVAMLSKHFECATAENGVAALEQITANPPAAVVTDLEMPEMNGLELLRRLRENESTKTLPVVIVTTVTAIDTVNECRRLGCAGFVLKPVQIDYLIAKLRQLIAKKT